MNREADVLELKGVGEKTAGLFHKLRIDTVEQLLHTYPRDYEDFREPVPIAEAPLSAVCAVRGLLTTGIAVKRVRNLSVVNFVIRDASGQVNLTYFNMPYLKNTLKKGIFYVFRGVMRRKNDRLVMEQPKIYQETEYCRLVNTLQPHYPLTAGLTNHAFMKAVRQALSLCPPEEEFLPAAIIESHRLSGIQEALEQIHFPENYDRLLGARNRLAFDEFFLFLLMVRKLKDQNRQLPSTHRMLEVADTARLTEALPYPLTGAQRRVWEEIRADLSGEYVMNRLIQGDVGSGKTILAVLALLMTAANGYQGAMMAPTEVLAKQHFESVRELTRQYHLPIQPVLLTGSMSAREKKAAYEDIAAGRANVILGTHALIQEKVGYHRLALVVTDEQHRFGVGQRETLAGKGENVHVLVMSATPIPRTLALILYGDLSVSILDERPAQRLPVRNCVVGADYREKAYQFIAGELRKGRQAYVICPMVEEGELEGVENVQDYVKRLRTVFPEEIQIAGLHGKLPPAQKNKIMEDFAARNIDLLVSTTVIEVGINVPNATVMMVENAERFGLAQLHQLRGRVGRGEHQSYCIFVSSMDNQQTMERLDILNHSNDGFAIAEQDLRLRGPGDLFGVRQSGIMNFRIADIYHDAGLLERAAACVDKLLSEDPDLQTEEHAMLKRRLETELRNSVDFRTI